MKLRLIYLIVLFHLQFCIYAQVVTGFNNDDGFLIRSIPDSSYMNEYYDSISKAQNIKLLTGFTYSIYNEIAPNVSFNYSYTGSTFIETKSDVHGRFFIPVEGEKINNIYIKVSDREYHTFDTIINSPFVRKKHLSLRLSPRHKIVLRGRLIIGSLPTEDIDVTIVHNADTSRLKTLDCYIDNENYWNCLYKGMFKHSVVFDNPEDSVYMFFRKKGFNNHEMALKIADYDGEIIPVKMNYATRLSTFPRHNIALKFCPPFTDSWSVGLDYTYMLNVGSFNRIGIGLESKMLFTKVESEIATFPNVSGTDPASIPGNSDSTYTSGMFMPHLTFWLTNPEKRFFSFYAGAGFPFAVPINKFFVQPFIGSRLYLDINKALLLEIRYVNYELDIVEYAFNAYGNAYRTESINTYNNLMFNIGLQVSF